MLLCLTLLTQLCVWYLNFKWLIALDVHHRIRSVGTPPWLMHMYMMSTVGAFMCPGNALERSIQLHCYHKLS